MKFEWEDIYTSEDAFSNIFMETFRAKVIGGWIVSHQILLDEEKKECLDGWSNAHNSMVFVPDPDHEWEIDDLYSI